jgi:hypothetical protein
MYAVSMLYCISEWIFIWQVQYYYYADMHVYVIMHDGYINSA